MRDTTYCWSISEYMRICLPKSCDTLIHGPIIHKNIPPFIKTEYTLDTFYRSVIFKIWGKIFVLWTFKTIIPITKYESFFHIESKWYNFFGVFESHFMQFFEFYMLKCWFFFVGNLYNQRTIKSILHPFSKNKRD